MKLLEELRKTFDIIPISMGEYKIIDKNFEKGKEKEIMTTTLEDTEATYTKKFDEAKQPLKFKEEKTLYGRGCELRKQL
jgi:hypothetical protein